MNKYWAKNHGRREGERIEEKEMTKGWWKRVNINYKELKFGDWHKRVCTK